MKWLGPFSLLVLMEIAADVFAKIWERTGRLHWAAAAQAAYFTGNAFWLVALTRGAGMARGGVLFSVSVAVTAVIVGVVGGERVGAMQGVGLFLGIVSIAVLSMYD